jgi:YYY domain-containing protein
MQNRLIWLVLWLPALLTLVGWHMAQPAVVRPADFGPLYDLRTLDHLAGFEPVESNAEGAYRWSGSLGRLSLPAHDLPATLLLRGAVAPQAQIALRFGDALPVVLTPAETAPQLRQYRMLLPATSDHLGWVALELQANPASVIDGRELGMAVFEVALHPTDSGQWWPPRFTWLVLSSLPMLLALSLALAGVPQRYALALATTAGVALVMSWGRNPAGLLTLLRDLDAFFDPLLLRWWLAIQGLGLVALPLTSLALRALPLAGYPLARTVGLLLVTLVAWMLAMTGRVPFGLPLVLVSSVLIGAMSGAAWWWARRCQLSLEWPGWRSVLSWELLFASGLLVGAVLCWHGSVGPAIDGGEKPMQAAFINAVMRYENFPPYSPWLAGYAINYYYLSYVTLGVVALLTATPALYAFNLGFVLFVALMVINVAYLAVSLAHLTMREPAGQVPRYKWAGVAGIALLFVLAFGNQGAAIQLALGTPHWRFLDPDQLLEALGQRFTGAEVLELSRPTVAGWDRPPRTFLTVEEGWSFDWSRPIRILYDDVLDPRVGLERRQVITEFPAFNLYLGDVHPHMMVIPFSLLALALALALVAGGLQGTTLVLMGIVVGALYCINAWDAPTYALMGMGAIVLSVGRTAQQGPRLLLLSSFAFGLVAFLTALPFMATFTPPSGPGPHPLVADVPLLGRLSTILGWSEYRTNLFNFLLMFGLFLIPILVAALRGPGLRGLHWAILLTFGFGMLIGFPLLFLVPLALLLALRAWQAEPPGLRLAFWAATVGALVLFAPEVVYTRDHLENIASRQNTIFKFYYQVWLIWGLVAAYSTWWLLARHAWRWRQLVWIGPLCIFALGAAVYPLGLVLWADPWQPGERTFNGAALLARQEPDEFAGIEWLAQHVAPDERVMSGFCSCEQVVRVSRAAAFTGVQSLLGWLDGHERLWRSGIPEQLRVMQERERDITTMYTATDPETILALLAANEVRYIVMGPLERELHGVTGDRTFPSLARLVFQQGDFAIYRVDD